MSTNQYFNKVKARNEQNLVEDLVVEAIKIHGLDVFYLPRTLVNKDTFYGEDPISRFGSNKPIEMYLENVNGYSGQQDLLSKFGLQIKDSASFVVSKRRFQKETGMLRPLEGDLIYFPVSTGLFEIKFVEHENPFYTFGKNYTFKLNVELFQFSEETFHTDDTTIDTIASNQEYTQYLSLASSGAYVVGDTVYQYTNGATSGGASGADARAAVKSVSGTTLAINNIVGEWLSTTGGYTRYAISNDGTVYRSVTGISDSLEVKTFNDNTDIQDFTDVILDKTKRNPFGTP